MMTGPPYLTMPVTRPPQVVPIQTPQVRRQGNVIPTCLSGRCSSVTFQNEFMEPPVPPTRGGPVRSNSYFCTSRLSTSPKRNLAIRQLEVDNFACGLSAPPCHLFLAGRKMVESRNVFSGNPVIPGKRGNLSTQDLENLVTSGPPQSNVGAKVLPVYNGKPLVTASLGPDGQSPNWQLGWIPLDTLVGNVDIALGSVAESAVSRETLNFNSLVYLGEKDGTVFLCLDVSPPPSPATGTERRSSSVQSQLSKEAAQKFSRLFPDPVSFVELRTLMVATPWSDDAALAELSIAGHASTMAEWHRHSQFCENCGSPTQAIEAGQRRQCTGLACKAKAYPRLNPVVIMLVIDKERDRVVMGRQSRLPARMWSCLAGFIELGESLEEAVRRETREEVGIEVGEVVYHSSQPWPVGAPGMPCQLMIGFVGVAKTFDIHADNRELEDAQWFSRDQIRKALTFNEHKKAQLLSAIRVYEACTGEASSNQKDPFADFRVEWSGEEGTTMFVPGPFAIAHKLIVDWVEQGAEVLLNKL